MSEDTIPSGGDDVGTVMAEWADEDTTERNPETDEAPEAREARPDPKAKPDAKAKPAAKPESKKDEKPRTYTLKANGRETAVPADAIEAAASAMGVDPSMLLRGAQMFRAGQESKREAAEAAKKAAALEAKLKTDPRAALVEMLGPDKFSTLAIDVVRQMMEEEELQKSNPQEIARRKAAAEVERLQAEADKLSKAKESEEAKAYAAQVEDRLGTDIRDVLEAGKLPKDPYVVKRLAALMLDHMDAGGDADDLSAADFVPLLTETLQKEHAAFLDALEGDQIISMFPKVAEKIRAAYVAKAKGGRPSAPQRREPSERTPEPRRPASPVRRGGYLSGIEDFVKGR